jgi:hypothetical protein
VNLYTTELRLRDELEIALDRARRAEARVEPMARLIDIQSEKIKRLRKSLSEHIGVLRVARVERGED